jgi:hypothetical protein
LEQHEEIEPRLRERWEDELTAAIEAEYRNQRAGLVAGLQWWFRDVWLASLGIGGDTLCRFPELTSDTRRVASRLETGDALGNLRQLEETQRLLGTNVQEALALEVGLLRLKL